MIPTHYVQREGQRASEEGGRGWLSNFSHDLIPAALSKGQDHTGGGFFFFFLFFPIPHLSGQYFKLHGCVIGE